MLAGSGKPQETATIGMREIMFSGDEFPIHYPIPIDYP